VHGLAGRVDGRHGEVSQFLGGSAVHQSEQADGSFVRVARNASTSVTLVVAQPPRRGSSADRSKDIAL